MEIRVKLEDLEPNPFRDFSIDPVDQDAVAALRGSIERHGFWGGVVCRRLDGHIQIAAGHHRVVAAMQAGIKEGDVSVFNHLSDMAMIQIYADENATQRGSTSTAVAGTVVSVLRYIARILLTGDGVRQICEEQKSSKAHPLEMMRVALTSESGIGETVIWNSGILAKVPRLSRASIREQLANLKGSGDYARIISEVQEEIDLEHQQALKALEAATRRNAQAAELERLTQRAATMATAAATAKIAARAAAKRQRTFDFEGVSKHLKSSHHVTTFRHMATSPAVAPSLDIQYQAPLAERLVSLAEEQGTELTGAFIERSIRGLLANEKFTARKVNAPEQAELLQEDDQARADAYQEDIIRHLWAIKEAGEALETLRSFKVREGWTMALDVAEKAIKSLRAIRG